MQFRGDQIAFVEVSFHMLCGKCALQVLVGHPMDTIKVRIQTMEVVPGKPPPYTGMVDCAKQIIAKEGVCVFLLSYDQIDSLLSTR